MGNYVVDSQRNGERKHMVIGIGIDSTRISEIARITEEPGSAFERHTFTEIERAYADNAHDRAQALAGTFAAKEAVCKALAHHAQLAGADLRDVEVRHHEDGAPYVAYEGKLAQAMEVTGATSVLVSITNEGDFAIAIALAQR